jgi:hypothetical protein
MTSRYATSSKCIVIGQYVWSRVKSRESLNYRGVKQKKMFNRGFEQNSPKLQGAQHLLTLFYVIHQKHESTSSTIMADYTSRGSCACPSLTFKFKSYQKEKVLQNSKGM